MLVSTTGGQLMPAALITKRSTDWFCLWRPQVVDLCHQLLPALLPTGNAQPPQQAQAASPSALLVTWPAPRPPPSPAAPTRSGTQALCRASANPHQQHVSGQSERNVVLGWCATSKMRHAADTRLFCSVLQASLPHICPALVPTCAHLTS
jgi:hypothetical protein